MHPELLPEHQWLLKLVGEWAFESECQMGPDQPVMKNTGTEVVRSVGGLWTQGEMTSASPTGENWSSVMTLGYDPQKKRFVGTFIASVMSYLWLYDGGLDATGKILILDAEGPGMTPDAGLLKYQDRIEILNDNERLLSSQVQGDDGNWQHFMTARYRRT